ncbi:MAG: prepilin-type N-terminal cleavage/methylation domain-containing protein [Planctomycetes bacterium]|nr:prepilin-type N-terminal cleavage/methylation domain-containing protein [Planctomycetota bacterium]MCG2682667.1 prepilin-type N-terminal cleavage/methylation domain-containing protein [Planctomycetales bacterium]
MKVRQRKTNAFTLVEVMVVLIVVAVLTAFCVPSFQRALEQSRADVAAANLRAIWSAERLYWLENHAYTADLSGLQDLGMIDPEIVLSTTGYVYSATTAADGFQATAERTGSTFRSGQLMIDETGAISGEVTAGDGTVISPGFQ